MNTNPPQPKRTKFPPSSPLSNKKQTNCPDNAKVRGYSANDRRCSICFGRVSCVANTSQKLLSIRDNINRRLFTEPEDEEFLLETNWINWPDEYQFDELRWEIEESIFRWANRWDDFGYLSTKAKSLHEATQQYLDKTWIGWREWAKQFTDNIHVTSTKDIEKLKWSLRMPYFIMDSFMKDLSGSAWKVICYIARRTTFDPKSNHYGRCWLRYDEIQKWAGVKQPERCIKELVGLGLLKVEHIRRRSEGAIRTTNEFTIMWFRNFREIGVPGYTKE